ncbi:MULTISPECIES: hypothetical protein [Mesorhizobium]|nr:MULTISPECIES: hypothetical protein [Mesorhizobium]
MDGRIYKLYSYYASHLQFFKDERLAKWAIGHHVRQNRYTTDEYEAALAEHERLKADPSPMLHITELEDMVANATLSTIPPELRR